MKMKRIFYLLVFAMLALLITACSTPFTASSNNDAQKLELFKGTKALTLSFMKNLPPYVVYSPEPGSSSPFRAGVQVENVGSDDINTGFIILSVEDGYVKINRWDTEYDVTQIGAVGQRAVFKLPGRTQFNPVGGKELFVIDLEALYIGDQATKHTSPITFTACYDYTTKFSDEVCINTDIYDLKPTEKVCEVRDFSVSGGQGAPVEVVRVEQDMMASENSATPHFVIYITNSGGGEVIDKTKTADACSAAPVSYDDFNVVDIEEVRVSSYSTLNGQMECNPMKIKLRDGSGKTRCSIKSGLLSSSEAQSFVTPFYVQLGYGYTQSISTEVSIENILA